MSAAAGSAGATAALLALSAWAASSTVLASAFTLESKGVLSTQQKIDKLTLANTFHYIKCVHAFRAGDAEKPLAADGKAYTLTAAATLVAEYIDGQCEEGRAGRKAYNTWNTVRYPLASPRLVAFWEERSRLLSLSPSVRVLKRRHLVLAHLDFLRLCAHLGVTKEWSEEERDIAVVKSWQESWDLVRPVGNTQGWEEQLKQRSLAPHPTIQQQQQQQQQPLAEMEVSPPCVSSEPTKSASTCSAGAAAAAASLPFSSALGADIQLRAELLRTDGSRGQCFYHAMQLAYGLQDHLPIPEAADGQQQQQQQSSSSLWEFPTLRMRIESALARIQLPCVLELYGLVKEGRGPVNAREVEVIKQEYLALPDTIAQKWGGSREMHLLALYDQGKTLFHSVAQAKPNGRSRVTAAFASSADDGALVRASGLRAGTPKDEDIEREIWLHHGHCGQHYELLRLYDGKELLHRRPPAVTLEQVTGAIDAAFARASSAAVDARKQGAVWLRAAFTHNRQRLQRLLDQQASKCSAAGGSRNIDAAERHSSELIALWAVSRWANIPSKLVRSTAAAAACDQGSCSRYKLASLFPCSHSCAWCAPS
jgi:hypothetical protein